MATVADAMKVIAALSKDDFDKLMIALLKRVHIRNLLKNLQKKIDFATVEYAPLW